MRNADQTDQWIMNVRARLAARKNGRPSTKAGAVRALWPEIQQALENGQTLKSIRDWLEVEGIPLRYSQLTSYVRRIRRKQAQAVPPAIHTEMWSEDKQPAPEPDAVVRDPLANLRPRAGRPRTFEYNPEFKEEELL
jgi:hypothetical protein